VSGQVAYMHFDGWRPDSYHIGSYLVANRLKGTLVFPRGPASLAAILWV